MITFSLVSMVAAGLSVVALVWSSIAMARAQACLKAFSELSSMKEKVDRFSTIDESVVRSVMEEGSEASVEAVLVTTKRLVDMGVTPITALTQAREMIGRA